MSNILKTICYLMTENVKDIQIIGKGIRVIPLNSNNNDMYNELKGSFSKFMTFCSCPPLVENKYKEQIDKLLTELKNKDIDELISMFYMKDETESCEANNIIDLIIELNDIIYENGDVYVLAYDIAEFVKKNDCELATQIIKEGVVLSKVQKKESGIREGLLRLQNSKMDL